MTGQKQPGGRLAGKSAMVTGAANGVGLAIARRFAEGGAKVLGDLDEKIAVERAQTLSDAGWKARGLRLDVSAEVGWHQAFAAELAEGESVDTLVNNAGIPAQDSIEEASLAASRR